MSTFSFKQTFFKGIALAIPVGVIFYVFIRLVAALEKIITPLASRLGVDRILGEITLTVFTLLLMLIMILILGLLMQLSFVARFRTYIEGWILRVVPSLNHLKLIAAEKLDGEKASVQWKPVFVLRVEQQEYLPAYIIEETEDWITLSFANIPSTDPGQVLITRKSLVKYKEISMKEMHQFNREFGKGYLALIDPGS